MTATAATQLELEVSTREGQPGALRVRSLIRRRLDHRPTVAATVFLGLLVCLIALRGLLPDDALRDMPWLLAVALVPILPWLLPLVADRVKTFRAGPVELDFQSLTRDQATPPTNDLERVALSLTGTSIADMPSRPQDIVECAREIEADRTEVVVINLGGARWQLATLYFCAFLLESRTRVRRLVLEDRGEGERTFLGMCSARALRRSIEREYPVYRDVRSDTPIIDLDQAGETFFQALGTVTQDRERAEYTPTVSARRVVQILGAALERDQIDGRELEGLPGVRRVLSSEHQYLVIVEGGHYRVIDKYLVALDVARRATSG